MDRLHWLLAVEPNQIFEDACNKTDKVCAGSKSILAQGGLFDQVGSVLTFLIGGISVVFIILGALRYVTSAGDPSSIKSAKDTITYAIVGVIVALVGNGIVSFVVNRLG